MAVSAGALTVAAGAAGETAVSGVALTVAAGVTVVSVVVLTGASGFTAVSAGVLTLAAGATAAAPGALAVAGAGVLAVSEGVLAVAMDAAAAAQCPDIMFSSVTTKLLSVAAELTPLALCPIRVTSWPRCGLRSTPLVAILKVKPVLSSTRV
jgi:hypothetical protein